MQQKINKISNKSKILKILFFIFALSICFCAKAQDLTIDSDNDGLSDYDEINKYFTNPENPDTDADGYNDGDEIKNGFSPLVKNKKLKDVDSDSDGLNDAWELAIGTNLSKSDTDNDSYSDKEEVFNSFDPLSDKATKIEKLITVDLKTQELKYFFGDKELEHFKISSGTKKFKTPTGTFSILEKVPVKRYKGSNYNYPNTKWNLRFTKSGLFIHGAYWHNKFGTPMSHGCINVSYSNMEMLYNWAQIGTKVIIK